MAYDASSGETLVEIVRDKFGDTFADRVIANFGGSVIHIPINYSADNLLCELAGEEWGRWLCAELGGDTYYVTGKRNIASDALIKAVKNLSAQGCKVMDIARRLGVSERWVYQIRADLRARRLLRGGRNP